MKQQWRVIYAGCSVLAAIVLILASMAFLGGGHPPASGIVNLLIIGAAYPLSVYGSIVGLRTPVGAVAVPVKLYFVMAGACATFAIAATTVLVLKFAFGLSV